MQYYTENDMLLNMFPPHNDRINGRIAAVPLNDLLAPIKLLFLMPELSETAWSLEASLTV